MPGNPGPPGPPGAGGPPILDVRFFYLFSLFKRKKNQIYFLSAPRELLFSGRVIGYIYLMMMSFIR